MASAKRIQSVTGANTTFASSVSATFTSPNDNGNIILLAWEGDSAAGTNTANTPTDTAGNTYKRLISTAIAATFDLEIWVAYNIKPKAGNVVTVTDTNAGVDSLLIAEEWSGATMVTALDGSSGTTGSGSPLTSGNIITSAPNVLLWVAGVEAIGANDLTASTGYSGLNQTSTTFSNLGVCSQVTTSPSTYNGGFTSIVTAQWVCTMVALVCQDSNRNLGAKLRPHPFSPGMAR
jgi:hypothetical protein